MEYSAFSASSAVKYFLAAAAALLLAACRPAESAPGSLPRVGLAVTDTAGAWCAEFLADSSAPPLEPGRRVTIVFPGPGAVPSVAARLGGRQPGECWAAFPQPRWFDYVAYRLEELDSRAAGPALPPVALVVVSEVRWTRGADSIVRADLDGDGMPEEARRCTADEGEHFTVWSPTPEGGRVRRWHEYYDWGGFTDPTCGPGEDGS